MRVALSVPITLLFAVTVFGDYTPVGIQEGSPQVLTQSVPDGLPADIFQVLQTAELENLEMLASVAEIGKRSGDGWVPSGGHGDIYAHYASSEGDFESPPETMFGPRDPLYLHAYVAAKYADTFICTFYLLNTTLRQVLPFPCLPQSTETEGNLLICFPFRWGIFIEGDYILFAQVTTGEGGAGTSDWGIFPLATFSVVEPE